jgi:hypothetical protein
VYKPCFVAVAAAAKTNAAQPRKEGALPALSMSLVQALALVTCTLALPLAWSPDFAPMQHAVLAHLHVAAATSPIASFASVRACAASDAKHCTLANGLTGYLAGLGAWYLALVLFGAPLWQMSDRTLLLSSVFSAFTALPFALVCGQDVLALRSLFIEDRPRSEAERRVYFPAMGLCVGAWLGSLPMLLDWDRPWQQWPIPVFWGGIAGWALGFLALSMQPALSAMPKSRD